MLVEKLNERLNLSKGEQLVHYIIHNTNPDTFEFSKTYKEIQNDLQMSPSMIAEYMRRFEDSGTIVRSGRGRWKVLAIVRLTDSSDGPDLHAESYIANGKK